MLPGQSGDSLKIDPATTVNCLGGSKLVVNGKLIAVGKYDSIIVFASPVGQTWQGIEFNGAPTSQLKYSRITRATTPVKATNATSLVIQNVTIDSSSFYNGTDNAAMSFYGSAPSISSTGMGAAFALAADAFDEEKKSIIALRERLLEQLLKKT